MKTPEEITNQICEMTYMGEKYKFPYVSHQSEFKPICSAIITNGMMELATENATLQAKVNAYESILKNSNFAMAVIDEKKKNDEAGDYNAI